MFSLIITIISIALVAALALATIYYGGSAFTQGGDAARAAQVINEGQQLQGARTLAVAAANANVVDMATLVSQGYLSQTPANWSTDGTVAGQFAGGSAFTLAGQTDAVCAEVNKKATGDSTATKAEPANSANMVYFCADGAVTYKF